MWGRNEILCSTMHETVTTYIRRNICQTWSIALPERKKHSEKYMSFEKQYMEYFLPTCSMIFSYPCIFREYIKEKRSKIKI